MVRTTLGDDEVEHTTVITDPMGTAATGGRSTARPHYLELVEGPGAPRYYELCQPATVVGRSEQSDLQVDSDGLSRKHLLVTRHDGEFVVEDLDSRNGVFLNGVKIHSATLRDMDTLQLGPVVFVYHEGD
ncbi:MAG: FHA domain-containing protein [Deltaproteobacteria bacterium]|nr:FHA domain-containing protein [Deltaproteobacteria bacterium]